MTTPRVGKDFGLLWLLKVTQPTLATIPRDQLVRDPHQPRKKFNKEKLENLARSIKSNGLQQHVIVNPGYAEGKKAVFYIDKGERRVRSHGIAGIDKVHCIVLPKKYDGKYDVDRDLAQASENSCRESHTPVELVLLVQRVVEATRVEYAGERGYIGIALQKVDVAFGEWSGYAQRYHRLGALHPDLLELLDEEDEEKKLGIPDALALAVSPSDEQQKILQKALVVKKKKGGVAMRQFIAHEARKARAKRGEKVRGRKPSDEKAMLERVVHGLNRLSNNFCGERHSTEHAKFVEQIVSGLSTIEVDQLLGELGPAIVTFTELKKVLDERRKTLYKPYQVKRK